MSPAATIAVDPPTDPAVCTRIIGLPVAPSASARYDSGIMTPSNMSGALPMTTASMSLHVSPASSSARWAPSRTSPAMETSSRLVLYAVCPMPMIAQALPIGLSRRDADEVLLQARAGRGVAECPVRAAVVDPGSGLTEPDQAGGHHRIGRQRPARRVDPYLVGGVQRLAQDQFLVAELRVQFRHLDVPGSRLETPDAGGLRAGQVTGAERVRVGPVVDATDPGGALAHLARPRGRSPHAHRAPGAGGRGGAR